MALRIQYVRRNGMIVCADDKVAWLAARYDGVTATDCSRIVCKNGRISKQRAGLLWKKLGRESDGWFGPFAHGVEREPVIAEWVLAEFGIPPNRGLCRGENPRHLATPDALSSEAVAEFKTSVRPLKAIMTRYSDQLQWQMHVTGADCLLFVVENRDSLQREWEWVPRDDQRLRVLVAHADAFLERLDAARERFGDGWRQGMPIP